MIGRRSLAVRAFAAGTAVLVAAVVGGCGSKDSSKPTDLTPGPGQVRVVMLEPVFADTFALAKRVATVLDVGPANQPDFGEHSESRYARYSWGADRLGDDKPVVNADMRAGWVDYDRFGVDSDVSSARRELFFHLDPVVAKAKAAEVLRSLGIGLDDVRLTVVGKPEDSGDLPVLGLKMVDGAPIDSLNFGLDVWFGENYEITTLRLSAKRLRPVGVADWVSAEDALQSDPSRVGTPATGEPTKILVEAQVERDKGRVKGRYLMVPGWSIPVLEGIDQGVTVPAIRAEDLKRLLKTARGIEAPFGLRPFACRSDVIQRSPLGRSAGAVSRVPVHVLLPHRHGQDHRPRRPSRTTRRPSGRRLLASTSRYWWQRTTPHHLKVTLALAQS